MTILDIHAGTQGLLIIEILFLNLEEKRERPYTCLRMLQYFSQKVLFFQTNSKDIKDEE